MSDNHIFKKGDVVYFHEKVFGPPWQPYYDKYKDLIFVVVALHYDDTHVELTCLEDPNIKVDGYVHLGDIVHV